MPVYVDTSALLKRYLDEPDSDAAESYLMADPSWFSGQAQVARGLGFTVLGV